MQLETVTKIAQRLFESPFVGDELTVVWHAGEPLAVPVSFYESAYEIFREQSRDDKRVIFSFQTNAMLVTEKWCKFFLRTRARVGVSIDGPKHIHDAHRVDRSRRGTFDRAMRGLKLLQASGVRPSVIMVLTRGSLDYPDEIWRFLTDNEIGLVGFNPEEAEGINIASSMHTDEAEREYSRFLSRFLAINLSAESPVRLREYESITSVIRSGEATIDSHDNIPMAIVSFDCDGNVSTFSPELLTADHPPYGRFTFSNVFREPLTDVLIDGKFQDVYSAIRQGVQQCRATCDYYRFCGGGSPSNKIVERGTFAATETRACRLRIKVTASSIADHLLAQPATDLTSGGSEAKDLAR
jgi:uncharacterized protein